MSTIGISVRGMLKQRFSHGVMAQAIGGTYNQFMRTLAYWSAINSVILLVLAWDTGIGRLIRSWFPWLSFPLFLFSVPIVFLIIMLVDFLVVLPAVYAFANRQQATHENPIYDELKAFRKEMNARQDKLQEAIDLILKDKNG